MIRLVLLLLVLAALAFGVGWLADRPGEIAVVWQGWRVETTVPVALAAIAVAALAMLLVWKLIAFLARSPKMMAHASRRRRRENGWHAVSRGLLAVGIGDHAAVKGAQAEAVKLLPHEPLTHLLTAQAAQLDNNHEVAVAAFRAMVDDPATRLLGLRGLHMEARKAGDRAAAYAIAEEAADAAPNLGWAAEAVIEARSAAGDHAGARSVLERQMASRGIDKAQYRRRKAVLLTAEAIALEQTDPAVARERALDAVRLAPTLVPAAACAGRLLGAAGELRKAAKIVETAFAANPHPELADVEAYLRPGDAAQDRLKRIRALVNRAPSHRESAIALARAAIDAQEFQQARMVLEPLLAEPSQRICLLMAELEAAEHADIGKAREWTARAVRANRDPAWIADGVVSDRWAAISPVTGRLDAFVWEVPPGVSATPILEHEAERVKAAIAAVRAGEEARAMQALEEAKAAEDRAAEEAAAQARMAEERAMEQRAAQERAERERAAEEKAAAAAASAAAAAVVVTPVATPAAEPRSPPARRADPIVAVPPVPDDPGPDTEEPDAVPDEGKKRRLLGL